MRRRKPRTSAAASRPEAGGQAFRGVPPVFNDHDPQAGEQRRRSVVAPAKRSPAALAKAARKRTADDLPVHSFRTLLTDLGTLTVNTMRVADTAASFPLQTQPTPVQQRWFELLGVTPRM